MAIQATGQISFDDANIELQRASGTQISFNDVASRRLATTATRTRTANNSVISITDWYSATYTLQGQALYTTVGTTDWTCPEGVYSVCAVAIGGGGGGYHSGAAGNGGGGGALAWRNNIAVIPGSLYTVVVGQAGVGNDYGLQNGGDSYFINTSTVWAGGGRSPNSSTASVTASTYVGQGGGRGQGFGNWGDDTSAGGGGGAGGYSGNGGSQTGGAGGKGPGGDSQAGGGGGVNPYGQGSSGVNKGYQTGTSGNGGSGGQDGQGKNGGLYGAGGGGADASGSSGYGAKGCVRIIWGLGRAFPSTLTANQTAGTFYNGIQY